MAVVINELEIVVENQQPAQAAHQAAPSQQQVLEPVDLSDIAERLKLYRLRVLAH
jgi:hypothetical protein